MTPIGLSNFGPTLAERAAAKRDYERRYPPHPLDGCFAITEDIVREDNAGNPIGYDVLRTY